MKRLFLPFICMLACLPIFGRVICDTTCHAPEDEYRNFAVVSPVGRSVVQHIEQAPRLETLDGKTIAVVGVSFMAHVTHSEIKRLLEENYKNVTVLLTDEMGYAGPGFTDQAKYTAYNNGIAVLRTAEYPGAFATHTNEQLIENTRNVVWPQLIAGLTTPITQEEIDAAKSADHGDIRDDVFWGDIHQIDSFFVSMQWSDGLPFVPPTYDEANEYLKYTDYKWHETIAIMPGASRNVTAWHVAVNAIMAGCKPEYMPLLIALTKAMTGGDFRRTLLSTHGWIPYCIINGPVARQLGLDMG
ncbi:MAG: hypothetical protein IJS73_07395 [Paludibacteraceae bacterium]|nr:hypothetical protein [Paludibacteraceae bacterium]